MRTGLRVALRRTSAALLLSLVLPTSTFAQTFTRKMALASLERVMAGEVLHTNYGEGSEVQRAVNVAFERGDTQMVRLAQRAWRPILAFAPRPVIAVAESPRVTIESRTVLKLPRAATYSAEIFYSLNGRPFIPAGMLEAKDDGASSLTLTAAPRNPGFHHLRFQARITYGGAAADLPQEIRTLADVSYGVYDPERGLRPDIARFVVGPRTMSAYQLDPDLPGVPFIEWLRWLPRDAGAHAEDSLWTSVRCSRGPRELEHPSNFGDICALGYLPFGLVWIRTGRIEKSGNAVQWIVQPPEVLAIQLAGGPIGRTEIYALSELPELLAKDSASWPTPHVTLMPEDIVVTRRGVGNAAMLDISVTIRNHGPMDARDLVATMLTSNGNELYMFHVDVPRRGSTMFKWSERMPWPYGAVLVSVDTPQPRPPATPGREELVPDEGRAFRIVNPSLAPPAYLNWIRERHATSKGY